MREEGIPTSQEPKSQSKNESGREYRYAVAQPYGESVEKSVQQQTLDRSHPGVNHWEAGEVKRGGQYNKFGRPRLSNKKK